MKKEASGLEERLFKDMKKTKINELAGIILSHCVRKSIEEYEHPDDGSYYLSVSLPKLYFNKIYKEFNFDVDELLYKIGQACSNSPSRQKFMSNFGKKYTQIRSEEHRFMDFVISAVRLKLINEKHGSEIDAISIEMEGHSGKETITIDYTGNDNYEPRRYIPEFMLFGYNAAKIMSRIYIK